MSIYAIADLHLSLATDKPMDIFGGAWEGYHERIAAEWRDIIVQDDTVLIPGDISWAMRLCETKADFAFLEALPGKKILLKGNHDYWWETATKNIRFLREAGYESVEILHNNSFMIEGVAICGTRGWNLKTFPGFDTHDSKIYARELERLKLSISSVKEKAEQIIVMMHYPPIGRQERHTDFTDIIEEAGTDICVFGHIHSDNGADVYNYDSGKTKYRLVSGDYLNFRPLKLI